MLRHLLGQAEGRRWAVVVNDVAAINIDAQLVATAGAQRVVELGNGCVCCSVRDELAETVAELCAGEKKFDHLLIETTGVAEPRAIADLFVRKNRFGRSLSDFARLSALVTVIDARAFLAEMAKERDEGEPGRGGDGETKRAGKKPVFELMVDQAECADVLVLNKCDLAEEGEVARLEEILRGLNPRAEIFRAEHGQIASEVLLDRVRFDAVKTLGAAKWIRVLNDGAARGVRKPAASHEENYGIGSFVFEARRALVREIFLAWLATGLPAGLLRAKGFFWFADQPADIGFLSVAGGGVRTEFIGTWVAALLEKGVIDDASVPANVRERWAEPHGDRRQELVFIGTALDEAAMRRELEACLVPYFHGSK